MEQYIVRLTDGFCNCRPLPLDVNDGLSFLCKADRDDDLELSNEEVYRSPLDLRPLTLTNSQNKVVAGVITWIIKPVVEKAACSLQNGLAGGAPTYPECNRLGSQGKAGQSFGQQAMDDGNLCFSSDFPICQVCQ